ncbi:hypothetical protein [Pseudonocardia sp. NPDC049635]|uniref:hypothetical protein n=1 Tax=Pseudonocardia sp. NPDC049635 TaxID=3155506 RepID=UPI0033C06910
MTWHEPAPAWRLVADCDPAQVEHGDGGELRPTAARPFLVQTSVTGPRPEASQMADRARHRCEAVTSRAMARELWGGELTRDAPYELPDRYDWANPELGGGYVNPHLAATGGTVLDAEGDVLAAVAAVEQAVGERLLLGSPHVHVPVAALPALVDHLMPMGDLLMTTAGSVVVADYGYPADATPAVIYGSGPVTAWFGAIDVLDQPGEVTNVANNQIEVWAERPALVMFDPATLVSCQVTP